MMPFGGLAKVPEEISQKLWEIAHYLHLNGLASNGPTALYWHLAATVSRHIALETSGGDGVTLESTTHPVYDKKWWPGFNRDEKWAHPENRQMYRWAGAGPRQR